jgi:GntR family transcriptional activator of glc operon
MIRTGKSLTRSSIISYQLEELILDGTLKIGEKVPSERQLAQRLQASRPVIREALKELRGRGVITTVHGKGSFVEGMMKSPEQTNALIRIYSDHSDMLFDLLEVRGVLEGQAARLAALRATEKDLYHIKNAFDAMNDLQVDESNLMLAATLDHAFHQTITEASHNTVLIHTLQSLMKLMLDSVVVSVSNLYHRSRDKTRIDDYHRLIYNAIIDRNPESAEHAAMDHIRDVRDRIKEIEREEQRLVRAEIITQDQE